MTAYAEVIGDPIAHSRSPLIHRFWLDKLGIDGDYRRCLVNADALDSYLVNRTADPSWRGCNVTIPHKRAVVPLVADPDGIGAAIGALNMISRGEDDALIGGNSDAGGFAEPLRDFDLAGKHVVVVGAGGAARAILFALRELGVGSLTILNRSVGAADALLDHFGLMGGSAPLDAVLPPAALLVNATALGMEEHPRLGIDLAPLGRDAVVYDVVYAPLDTELLLSARALGMRTIDGLHMLIGQAAISFDLFFGQPAPRLYDAELRTLLTA